MGEGTHWTESKSGEVLREFQRQATETDLGRPRSMSKPEVPELEYPDLTPSTIAQPGGFRRQYLSTNDSLDPSQQHASLMDMLLTGPSIVRRFGGGLPRDDSDSEEDEEDDVSESGRVRLVEEGGMMARREDERLVGTGAVHPPGYTIVPEDVKTGRRRRTASHKRVSRLRKGGSSVLKLVVTILKSFVGSAVIYLPAGFKSGGILFSPIILALTCAISIHCMILLVRCKQTAPGSYGAIGRAAAGLGGRIVVDISLVMSQVGFCCAYVVFIAKNAEKLLNEFFGTPASNELMLLYCVLAQLPLYVPLSWVRKIRQFATTNLIADAFILLGLLSILTFCVVHVSDSGLPHSIELFNRHEFSVFMGTAVYSFEGIALVLPIHESTRGRVRENFSRYLATTLAGVCGFFIVFSCFGYAAFGEQTESVITLNLPHNSKNQWWVACLQIGYSLALVLTFPLMLFPATRLMEAKLFGRWPKSPKRKWSKNGFRALLCAICCAISYAFANQLDKLVALIGSICCVPLAFIYPSWFHYKLVAVTPAERALDAVYFAIGIGLFIFTTYLTLSS